jgi:hypothetical protein
MISNQPILWMTTIYPRYSRLFAALGMQGERYAISGLRNTTSEEIIVLPSMISWQQTAPRVQMPNYIFWLAGCTLPRELLLNAHGWLNRYVASEDNEFRQAVKTT